jgi:Tfp pilus assembly protein PilN
MTTASKPDAICIGLTVEGDTLRLAALGREGKSLRILSLASMNVPVAQHVHVAADDDTASSTNPFEKTEVDTGEEVDYSSVREFLANHYISGASMAVGLGEPYIRTFLTPAEAKEPPVKTVKRILAEVQHSLNLELTRDQVSYVRDGANELLVAARIETSPLIELFAQPLGTRRRGARLEFVTSNDVALLNLVRSHFRFRPTDVVHVINVGSEETRLYILEGQELRFMAPTVQQGANDRDFITMLNNRIELAAENAGYPKADAVVLCGHAEEIGLKEEILASNPGAVFHSLARLRVSHGDDEAVARDMRFYAAPISVAWEKLEPKNEHFHRINLLPSRIREEQKKMKLAWHGLVLLAVLFAATAGLTFLGLQKQEQIASQSAALEFEKRQVTEQQAIVNQITALENRSAAIVTATNTLDTLLQNSERWSETLDTLATGTGALRNLWISELKPDNDGKISIVGFAVSRAAAPSLSHLIGDTHLREISVQEIGKRKVFRYDVALAVPDLYPASGSRSAVWHDSVAVTLGDVSSRFAAAETAKKGVKAGAGTKGAKADAKQEKGGK